MSPEDSGTFPQLRRNTVWIPVSLVGAGIAVAVAWGVDTNRVSNLEALENESKAERQRIEEHLSTDDRQIAVMQANLLTIIEQLRALNTKADRAEDERQRK